MGYIHSTIQHLRKSAFERGGGEGVYHCMGGVFDKVSGTTSDVVHDVRRLRKPPPPVSARFRLDTSQRDIVFFLKAKSKSCSVGNVNLESRDT